MPFMDFLKKYQIPTYEEATAPTAVGATKSFNTAAEKQAADLERAARGEARQLATVEEQVAESKKQRGLQSQQEIQGLRNEATSQKQKYIQAAGSIKSDLERNLTQISEREKMDRLEGAAQAARLADEKYSYQLADEAKRRRLTDARQFDIALKESIFDEEIDLMKNDLKFRQLMDADEATFQRMLADMDIDSAFALASQQRKDENRSQMISGATEVLSKGASYYAGLNREPEVTAPKSIGETKDVGNINLDWQMG